MLLPNPSSATASRWTVQGARSTTRRRTCDGILLGTSAIISRTAARSHRAGRGHHVVAVRVRADEHERPEARVVLRPRQLHPHVNPNPSTPGLAQEIVEGDSVEPPAVEGASWH